MYKAVPKPKALPQIGVKTLWNFNARTNQRIHQFSESLLECLVPDMVNVGLILGYLVARDWPFGAQYPKNCYHTQRIDDFVFETLGRVESETRVCIDFSRLSTIFVLWFSHPFFEELGEKLKLIGEEIRPTDDVDDRINLLAIDSQGAAVVIELKRGTHKLHLLQALGYASMVSKWESSRFGDEYSRSTGKSQADVEEELEEFLDEDAVLNGAQRIILLAEDFEYEVLVTAEWLSEKYSVDVRCYRLAMSAEDHAEFLSCTCIYPPPEVTEHAKRRGIRDGGRPSKWASWDEALSAVENPAVKEFYRTELEAGRESYLRRRILRYRTDGRRRLSVIARRKLAYVWEHRRFKDDEKYWNEALGNEAQVQPVRNGKSLRFFLKTKEGFARFADAVKKLPSLDIIDDTDAGEVEDAEE